MKQVNETNETNKNGPMLDCFRGEFPTSGGVVASEGPTRFLRVLMLGDAPFHTHTHTHTHTHVIFIVAHAQK